MIEFTFTVNKSFLDWPSHPITVPKSQIDYARLESEGLARGNLKIEAPDGSTLGGEMYSGKAGYGFYYQIRIDVPYRHSLLDLRIGSPLVVQLERSGTTSWARLRSPRKGA